MKQYFQVFKIEIEAKAQFLEKIAQKIDVGNTQ